MVTAAPTALRTRRIHNWFRNRITFPEWMFKIMRYITKEGNGIDSSGGF